MKLTTILVPLTFSTLTAIAQPTPRTESHGQSWVGLLVTAQCDSTRPANAKSKTDATHEADLTTANRTTTPGVDQSGTRGSSTVLDQTAHAPSTKQTLPQTGDVTAKSKSATDPAWAAAQKQARGLAPNCAVDSGTQRFGLMLPDGSFLQFDELANDGIATRMPAMPAAVKTGKIFRVSVQGKLQNGKIALDSIEM